MAQTVIADDPLELVTREDEYTVGLDELGRIRISPTDVSQFIRLDQCERYLRLRLHERSAGIRFMFDYGVVPQSIPPLLTQSGAQFEERVERTVAAGFRTINLALEVQTGSTSRIPGRTDNERIVAQTRGLAAGETLVLFQPRLLVALGSWDVRGDIDVLRLSRDPSGALQVLIADIKSSTAAKVEHAPGRLLRGDGRRTPGRVPGSPSTRSRWTSESSTGDRQTTPVRRRRVTVSAGSWSAREPRICWVWRTDFWSSIVDAEAYRGSVRDLVTGEHSTARRVIDEPFADIPFHLDVQVRRLPVQRVLHEVVRRDGGPVAPAAPVRQREGGPAAQRDHHHRALAALKDFAARRSVDGGIQERTTSSRLPGRQPSVRRLAATWPVGPRLDELVHRARSFRRVPQGRHRGPDATSRARGTARCPSRRPTEPQPRPRLHRCPARLPARPHLPARRPGRRLQGRGRDPERRRSVVRMTRRVRPETAKEEHLLRRLDPRTLLRAVVELAGPR